MNCYIDINSIQIILYYHYYYQYYYQYYYDWINMDSSSCFDILRQQKNYNFCVCAQFTCTVVTVLLNFSVNTLKMRIRKATS